MGKEQEQIETTEQPLRDFAALFASDRDPVRIDFRVGGEKDAWVELTPMDSAAHDRFSTLGMKVRHGADGAQVVEGDIALDVRNTFLVANTLTDFCLWKRDRVRGGKPGERVWTQFGPPDNRRALPHFIEANLKCVPEFWEWLVSECIKVNGLDGATQGN